MRKIIKIGRFFFAVCMIGLAVQQCIYADFRIVIMPPIASTSIAKAIGVYIVSAGMIAASIAIIAEKQARFACLILGGITLALFVLVQVPYLLNTTPGFLAAWTSPLKELAISGCYFVTAGSFNRDGFGRPAAIYRILGKLIPFGPAFFGITMLIFGVEHFFYPAFVATLVPTWIPGAMFWTYFAGIALIAGGAAIIINIQASLAANLLGIAIFIWFIVLHIPRAIADPSSGDGNELASVFEAFGFSGICFVMGYMMTKKSVTEKTAAHSFLVT